MKIRFYHGKYIFRQQYIEMMKWNVRQYTVYSRHFCTTMGCRKILSIMGYKNRYQLVSRISCLFSSTSHKEWLYGLYVVNDVLGLNHQPYFPMDKMGISRYPFCPIRLFLWPPSDFSERFRPEKRTTSNRKDHVKIIWKNWRENEFFFCGVKFIPNYYQSLLWFFQYPERPRRYFIAKILDHCFLFRLFFLIFSKLHLRLVGMIWRFHTRTHHH